ncbi:hypothetical protein Ae263Ps1_4392 [Pseudonocardia sp. Ae263_Ps1]|nr:hypothetical protein Ae263Ps1_4392 [Pseudonocardia sp. Ae263_Ps1]
MSDLGFRERLGRAPVQPWVVGGLAHPVARVGERGRSPIPVVLAGSGERARVS